MNELFTTDTKTKVKNYSEKRKDDFMARQSKKNIDYTDVPVTLSGHPVYDNQLNGLILDEHQKYFRDCIWDDDKKLIICDAKAGSGKTTIAYMVADLLYKYNKFPAGIVYTVSPYGEKKQGYLPGGLAEKSEVYFEPIYQAILKCNQLPQSIIVNEAMLASSDKQVEPGYVRCLTHTYMRGINIEDSVVIIDEAQNFSFDDLKKTITRIHDSCKVIVIGHSEQRDTDDLSNGFERYLKYYKRIEDSGECRVAVCKLTRNYRGWISQTADDCY